MALKLFEFVEKLMIDTFFVLNQPNLRKLDQ